MNGNVWEMHTESKNCDKWQYIEQVTDFKYLGYRISEYKSDLKDKLQTYNILEKKWTKKQNYESTTLQPSSIQIWKWSLGTKEKRGTTFRSSTDEVFETLTWNYKIR
jgi:predicted SPOUT superfamily RNA methylase MTH1